MPRTQPPIAENSVKRNLRTLSVNQVMERTGWPRSMVYRLMHRKEIATIRVGARGNFHVLESSLEAFFDKNTVGADTSASRSKRPSRQAIEAAADAAVRPEGHVSVFS